MTLLQKIDAVLDCLYLHSAEDPNFAKIQNWLKDKEIDKGEIEDCLLHIYRRKHIYCEVHGQRNSDFYDLPDAHYLISFEGKLFKTTVGGYEREHQINESDRATRDVRDRLLVRGTWWVAGGAIALVVWEMLKYFVLEGHLCGE